MISVICVYNDRDMMGRILLPSLKNQTVPYETILVDNTGKRFRSAAEALNYGVRGATSKYLMFIHQDVELGSKTWLEAIEKTLDSILDLGVAGPIGMVIGGKTPDERIRGIVCNAGMDWGKPLTTPVKVQTLDECVLIIPREKFMGFDSETFDGWHCYGADYCLRVQGMGMKAYAIPSYVYHRSLIVNTQDLWKYQKRLYTKHRKHFSHIYTTSGDISGIKASVTPVLSTMFKLYYHYRKDWIRLACEELKDCDTILDLGCGYNSPLQHIREDGKRHSLTGVEIFKPYLEESRKKQLHDFYIESDLMKLTLPPKSFDAIFCSEVIEHLSWFEGKELLERMDKWATRKIIITTPNGYLAQKGSDNPYQEHKAGWSIKELRQYGFNKIRGMGGLKFLRDGNAEIRFKPMYFFAAMAMASQVLTDHIPFLAFQLLAIKRVK